MPDNPNAPVATLARGAQSLSNGLVDGKILVIAREFLPESAAIVFEDGERAQQVEQTLRGQRAANQHFQLRAPFLQRFPIHRTPAFEPIPGGGQAAQPGVRPIAGDQHGVGDEQIGDFLLVGLQLCVGGLDGGLLVGGVLEFDDDQRQTIDEQQHVRAAGLFQRPVRIGQRALFLDAELVDGQPVVGAGAVEVQHASVDVDRAPVLLIADRDAIHQQPIQAVVVDDEIGTFRADKLADGVIQGLTGQGRVELCQS